MESTFQTHILWQIIERFPVAIVGVDKIGVIWLWNAQAETLLGYTAHEMNGALFSTLLCAEDILIPEITSAGAYLRQKNTGLFYAHLRIQKQYDREGNYVGAAIHILNVYDNQPIEYHLRVTEARYKAIVEDQREIICRLTPQGYITFANNAFYEYFNLSRTQQLQLPFWELFDDDGSEKIKQFVLGFNAKRRTDVIEIFTVTSLSRVETRWQEWHGRLLISAEGTAEYQLIGRDITDSRLAEQQRIELAIERERARILRDFLSDVSHDLRTPIASILLALASTQHFVSRLEAHTSISSENLQPLLKLAASMQANTERLRSLLESMFEMMDYDTLDEYRFTPVDLNSAIDSIASAIGPIAKAKSIELIYECDPSVGLVALDLVEISRAIQNLLDNAIKYSPPQSTVLLRTGIIDNQAYIEIKDSGCGIAEHDLPHIFERFFRADPARRSSTGGSGLGLAISKKIIEAHKGTLQVESILDQGSTFRIILPTITQGTNYEYSD